jgi:transcriptional regulator with XRE-family HTH domain
MMRRIAGKTQAEYAKLVGVGPRVLIDFERGVGNPTVRTLARMFDPFGLELTVRRRDPEGLVEDDLARSRRPLRGPPHRVLPELRRRLAKIANNARVERLTIGQGASRSRPGRAAGPNQSVVRLYVTRDPRQASEVQAELLRTITGHAKAAGEPRAGERAAPEPGDPQEGLFEPTYLFVVVTTRP